MTITERLRMNCGIAGSALALLLVAPAVHAASYGVGVGGGSGEETGIMCRCEKRVVSSDLGWLIDTARPGKVFQNRLLLSLSRGSVSDFREEEAGYTGPAIPQEVDFVGARLANSLRFVIAPGMGSTFWIGPTFYLGYFSFEDQAGIDQGSDRSRRTSPSLGADVRGGAVALTLELAIRMGNYGVSEAQDRQYFDGVAAEETIVRLGFLWGEAP